MKLLIDLSSVLGAYLHLTDEEFGLDITYKGEKFHIPSMETSLERFQFTVSNLEIEPKDFIVIKDPGGLPRCRTALLPDYKKRPRLAPPEFFDARTALFDAATDWLRSRGAIIATPKNMTEADDLINQLAIRLPETIVWTRDKDMLAVPTDVIYTDKDGPHFNPDKFPVPDEYIHVYRTIVLGDASDNVGSCKGFGEKAWENMIAKYGDDSIKDLDNMLKEQNLEILESLVEEFPKFKLLVAQAEKLYTIYKVLSFFPVPAHKIKWEGGMLKGTDMLVTTDNYDQVFTQIKAMTFDYAVIDYEGDVDKESRDWSKYSDVTVDVMGQEITGMGLRINDNNYYFSVDHADTRNISFDQLEAVLEFLWGTRIYAHNAAFENTLTYNHFKALLPEMVDTMLMASYVDENEPVGLKGLSDRWLVYQHASYEETLNGKSGMRKISGEEVLRYGLDDVITTDAVMKLFTVIMHYENTLDVFHKVEDDALYYTTLSFINGVNFDQAKFRSMKAENDRNIEEAWAKLSDRMLDFNWEGGEYTEIKNMNIVTLNRIHKAAHGVDLGQISSVKMAIKMMEDRELAALAEKKDYSLINDFYRKHWKPVAEFNVRSPKQMSKLLYEVLGLPVRIRNSPTANMKKKNQPGNPASNEAAIQNAITYKDTEHIELLQSLLTYKGYLTRESLFFEKWPKYVHPKTGKIHCSMRQSATSTRRFSHSKPNNAQLPKKKGKEVRNMMTVPDDDWLLWALDIDSQELILQAWATQDPNFLACYQGAIKKDVHALTGYQVALKQGVNFGSYEDFIFLLNMESAAVSPENPRKLPEEEVKPKAKPFRVSGKATNFATAYLCRAPKLSQMLCVPESEAQKFIDAKAQAFPGLMPAVKEYIALCKSRGYSETFLGARRHLAGRQNFGSRKEFEIEAAGRLAWSFRIQSSGAEQIKLAAGAMYRKGIFDDGLMMPITIIHDELVGKVHKSVVEERLKIAYGCVCQKYADMGIETSSTPEVGSHFGELRKYKFKETD